jgi:type I restriction enzyme, S subunit
MNKINVMNWEKVKLDDICNVITCGVAKRPDYQDSGVPFLSSLNVKENRFILNSYKCISQKDHEQLTKYSKPEKGDILYTRVGSFGEAAVIDLDFEFSVFVSLTLIKPKHELVDSRYLMWHLNSPSVRNFANNNTSGIGVQNLNVGVVREFQIPLPPLPTQKRIAEILDAADALRRKDQALLKKYDELAQAIFIDMFGDPVKNEKGWAVVKCEDLFDMKLGKMLSAKNYTGKNLKKYLRNVNVKWGKIDISDLNEMDFEEKELDIYRLKKGDILVCEGGEVGRTAIFNEEVENCYYQNALHRLRVKSKEKIEPYFFEKYMELSVAKGLIRKEIISVTIQHFALEKFRKLHVIVPPLELQKDFVLKLGFLKEQLNIMNLASSESLFNSLIQKAFNGELVG